MFIGILANMSFNLVDTYFIGQLGVEQLTAISFSFPVVLTLLNLSIGLSIGLTSVLSRLLGQNEVEKVRSIGTQTFTLVVLIASLVSLLGALSVYPLFRLLGAGEESLPFIKDYMVWAYPAMGFRMISVCLSGTFKAHGITKVPSFAILTTAGLNFILDPFLIFGWYGFPELGIAGAGLATLLANFIAMAVEIVFALKFRFIDLGKVFKLFPISAVSDIFKIGIPAAFGNALNPLSLTLFNYLIALESTKFVAGFGIASKVQTFAMLPVLALSAGLGPMVGQNFGRKKKQRLISILQFSTVFCLLVGVLQGLILFLFGEEISHLFTDDQTAIEYSIFYLKWVGWSLVGYSFVIVISASFNAVGKPLWGMLPIALRTFVLFVLFYLIFEALSIENSAMYALFSSNFASCLVYILLFYRFRKKELDGL